MKNIKLLLSLVLVGMMILTGCANKATEEAATEEAATEEATTEEAATEEAATEEAATEEAATEEAATEEATTEEAATEEAATEEAATEEATTEEVVVEAVQDTEFIGSVIDGQYVNNFFGITLDLPEGWDETTEEEIAEWNMLDVSEAISEAIKAEEFGTLFISYSESGRASIDIEFEKIGTLNDDMESYSQSEYELEKEFLDASGNEYELGELESDYFNGKDIKVYEIETKYDGYSDVQVTFLFESNEYFISITAAAYDDYKEEYNDDYNAVVSMLDSIEF